MVTDVMEKYKALMRIRNGERGYRNLLIQIVLMAIFSASQIYIF